MLKTSIARYSYYGSDKDNETLILDHYTSLYIQYKDKGIRKCLKI